jgi:hypothetical protein
MLKRVLSFELSPSQETFLRLHIESFPIVVMAIERICQKIPPHISSHGKQKDSKLTSKAKGLCSQMIKKLSNSFVEQMDWTESTKQESTKQYRGATNGLDGINQIIKKIK